MEPYDLDDADADLKAAIDADADKATFDRIGDLVDALDDPPAGPTLHQAALYYASLGLHVFPLSPGSKIPFKGSGGCLDATDDPDMVNKWWTGNPNASIGIATGHLIDVVDVDGHVGQRSRVEHWEPVFEAIDNDAIGKVLTPRVGGMHIYVPATGEGNSTNIVPSVDYRGRGGYVVAPPSVGEVGRYRWLGTPDFTRLAKASA